MLLCDGVAALMKTPPPQLWRQPLLPEDAIVEILSWLPVKSLLRFRCVCRSWKSIISDPNFVKLHLQRSPRNADIILTLEDLEDEINICGCAVLCSVCSLLDNPSSTISDDGCYQLEDKYWVLGSCNGLVCLAAPKWRLEDTTGKSWFLIWNPATRITSERSSILLCELNRYFGFGYDDLSGTYKVVAVIVDTEAKDDSEKTQVKVYTMGDTCWRDIGSFPACPIESESQDAGVYTSSTLNWFALRNLSLGYEWEDATLDRLVIISLDLGKETYKQFLLPDGFDEIPHFEPILGVLMGCLCFSHEYRRTHFILWQMKEFGVEKSWTQLVNVSYQHLQIRYFPFEPYHHPLMPMCISENGHVVVLSNNEDLEVILYNCRDHRVERRAGIPNNKMWINPRDYIQSLVLPL